MIFKIVFLCEKSKVFKRMSDTVGDFDDVITRAMCDTRDPELVAFEDALRGAIPVFRETVFGAFVPAYVFIRKLCCKAGHPEYVQMFIQWLADDSVFSERMAHADEHLVKLWQWLLENYTGRTAPEPIWLTLDVLFAIGVDTTALSTELVEMLNEEKDELIKLYTESVAKAEAEADALVSMLRGDIKRAKSGDEEALSVISDSVGVP
jgi:hypothetical protein